MTLEEQVKVTKDKLRRIIDLCDARADAEIVKGEDVMGGEHSSFAAIGFATGVRFVRDVILDEFGDLFSDGDGDGVYSSEIIVPEPRPLHEVTKGFYINETSFFDIKVVQFLIDAVLNGNAVKALDVGCHIDDLNYVLEANNIDFEEVTDGDDS